MSDFTFNGISAASLGLGIERYPEIPMPRKRITSESVPGRSGDLHISDGSCDNVTIRYEVWWKNRNKNFPTGRSAREITTWLYSAPVGARLEDTYDSSVFRTATFVGGANIEDVMGRFGRMTLEFNCSPQKWLKSGETALTHKTPGGIIRNPTAYETKPLIRIVGSVGGLIKIGESYMVLRFPGTETHEFWMDCEEMEAWEVVDGQEVPSNAWIDSYAFLRIAPGANVIDFPQTWESVTVWGRFFEL